LDRLIIFIQKKSFQIRGKLCFSIRLYRTFYRDSKNFDLWNNFPKYLLIFKKNVYWSIFDSFLDAPKNWFWNKVVRVTQHKVYFSSTSYFSAIFHSQWEYWECSRFDDERRQLLLGLAAENIKERTPIRNLCALQKWAALRICHRFLRECGLKIWRSTLKKSKTNVLKFVKNKI
jgi:hypothetical protein